MGYAELTGMRSQRVMGSSGGYDAGWELDSSEAGLYVCIFVREVLRQWWFVCLYFVACALVRECFGDIFVDCALEVGARRFAEAGLCIRIFVACVVRIGKCFGGTGLCVCILVEGSGKRRCRFCRVEEMRSGI